MKINSFENGDITYEELLDATNMVNEGKHDFYDTDTTYYVPIKCLHVESGGDSPYGKFDKAYVLVTYNNDTYNYYWVSRDVTGQGIKVATASDDLKPELIVAGIKPDEIKTNTVVEDKIKVLLMDDGTCKLGDIDDAPLAIDENKIVDKVYIDNGDHNDGYTVVLEPPFDYTTLPNFNVYSSTNNVLNTNFRASVTDIPFDMMYAYYFYSDQNYNLRVKLLYNFPKFKKNSDGSMHTVKRFVANVYAKFTSSSGEEPKITYTCNITDTNSHIANCNLKNNNIVITKCKPGNSYCYVADNYEKGNAYYVLDNGDVISAKKASERNGVSHFVSSGGHISYEIRVHYTKFR